MNYKTTLQLARELGMEPELGQYLSTGGPCSSRFAQTIENIVETYQGENPSIKTSRKVGSGKYIDKKGIGPIYKIHTFRKEQQTDIPHLKKIENFSRALDFFKQKYGINTDQKSTKEISKETCLSNQTVLNGINFVKALISQRHKRDLWYGTVLGEDGIRSTESELNQKYGKTSNLDLDDFLIE